MAAQHALGQLLARLRQRHLAALIHLNIAIAHQAFQHLRHRGRSHLELFGQPRADHGLALHRHVIHGFQVLFDFGCCCGVLCHWRPMRFVLLAACLVQVDRWFSNSGEECMGMSSAVKGIVAWDKPASQGHGCCVRGSRL